METLCQFQLISGPRLLRVISFQSPGPAVLLTLTDPPPSIRYMPNGRRVWAPNSSAGETADATQGCDQGAMAKPPHLSR